MWKKKQTHETGFVKCPSLDLIHESTHEKGYIMFFRLVSCFSNPHAQWLIWVTDMHL